jgi:hypothetical protein
LKKLQLFYVYKFDTDRLKEFNNNITITTEQARSNGELVSVGDSQVFRVIRKITNSKYSPEKLKSVLEQEESDDLQKKIDELLHIPEYISIVVKNKKDYKKLIKDKLKINGKSYVRLMCGAGHARKNTVIFCSEEIEKELKIILKNGASINKISYSKYNAYFALSSGASYHVSTPRVCVIPDKIIKMKKLVDWVEEKSSGDTVEEKEVELEFNLFDGMGIISPQYAETWAKELGIDDYTPSAFRISHCFIKGMVCVMDFHKFGRVIAKTTECINDVWNQPIENIKNYDLILTESQFKLNKCFESWEQFKKNSDDSNLGFAISRVTPKEEKNYSFTNYQFIQAIGLNDEDVKLLCEPTVEWLNSICGADAVKTMLFMGGNSIDSATDKTLNTINLNDINNPIIQALLLNNDLINDPYIKKSVYNLIRKKIKESYIGKLLLNSNFQVMISDPYAFCEHLFGSDIKGLLSEKEYYSDYWNKNNSDVVCAMRSPLTWRSEVNKLNLVSGDKYNWYEYLNSGIVYNIHGVDCMVHADSDYDFDIVFTTNNKQFINCQYGGLPITYKKNMTLIAPFDEDDLYLSDIYAFDSQIGTVTNRSTSMYCMLSEYDESSKHYKELIKRLKICRKEQGSQIDKAKGIVIKNFPKEWIQYQKINDNDDLNIVEHKKFMNDLVVKRKPYFMRWLYSKSNNEYKKHKSNAETYCGVNFGCSLQELEMKDNKNNDELLFLSNYYKYLPLNEANCTMNKLCKYMESVKLNIGNCVNDDADFDVNLLLDKEIEIKEKSKTYVAICNIYDEFVRDKKMFIENKRNSKNEKAEEDDTDKLANMYKNYRLKLYEVCKNKRLLANIAIHICYIKNKNSNKDFVWEICNYGLIKNLKKNNNSKIIVPIKTNDESFDFEYLYDKYKLLEVDVIENFK